MVEDLLSRVGARGARFVVVAADDLHDLPVGAQRRPTPRFRFKRAAPPRFVLSFVVEGESVVFEQENRVFEPGHHLDHAT